jgi:hypothetical protein
MKTYTLSLTRWHKVAERLTRAYTQLTEAAQTVLTGTKVTGYLGTTQVERLRGQAAEHLEGLRHAFRLQDALVGIRRAIGEANARTGVNAELAEHDALARRQRFLERLLAAQTPQMIALEELDKLPAPQLPPTQNRYFSETEAALPVRTLDAPSEAALRAEVEELRTRAYALADHINDLNRERLTLELSEEAAQAAGL